MAQKDITEFEVASLSSPDHGRHLVSLDLQVNDMTNF